MGYHWLVLRWFVTPKTLQVQVNLKSSTNCALFARGSRTHHWRSFSTQWRRVVGAAVLRGTGADFLGACRLRASPLSPDRSCAALPLSSLLRRSDWHSRRSPRNLPSFPRIVFRLAKSGRAFRAHGQNASIKGSLSFNVSERG